jgi:cytochrome c-type biogenesis protein CcmI
MTLSLLAGLLVVLAVVLFIVQPLLTGEEAPMHRHEDELTEAQARKRVALMALRDVEYDFATGKLDARDYQELKGELAEEALAAIDHEEQVDGPSASVREDRDALESEIASYRSALREGVLCGGCGLANPRESRFCGSCGRPLGSPAVTGG